MQHDTRDYRHLSRRRGIFFHIADENGAIATIHQQRYRNEIFMYPCALDMSNLRRALLYRLAQPYCSMTRARFLTLADHYLGVGAFFSHENGAITTTYHQRWCHYGFMYPCALDGAVNAPPCRRVSSRGARLQHGTLDSLSLRA